MKERLLYTQDVREATAEVERLGGQVRQVFTPSLLVAVLPDEASPTTSSADPPAEVDEVTRMMAEAWHARSGREAAQEAIPWDTPGFEPPG
jgi:hypothetical protein